MNDYPIKGMTVMPLGMPLMIDAFLGCVQFAVGRQDIKDAFRERTGINLEDLMASPEAMMIDKATGRTQEYVAAFADFVAENVWGAV